MKFFIDPPYVSGPIKAGVSRQAGLHIPHQWRDGAERIGREPSGGAPTGEGPARPLGT